MNPYDFKPGHTMQQLYGVATDSPDTPDILTALQQRVQVLEEELRRSNIPVPSPEPVLELLEPPLSDVAPVAPSQPGPEATMAVYEVPTDIAELMALYPVVPTDGMSEAQFSTMLQRDYPALSFADWLRIAPFLIQAVPSFSLEDLKGWPSYDVISEALQLLKRSTTDSEILPGDTPEVDNSALTAP